jgi:CTP synthase (UTP-ammonia lyase)
VTESTTCNYGLDPAWQHVASTGGMVVSGVDDTGEVRAVERSDHPFFVATLYQPQLRSTSDAPHPIWLGFLRACADQISERANDHRLSK